MTSSDPDPALGALGEAGRALASALAGDRLAPAYLLEGADPEVLDEAARLFATAVLSQGLDEEARARVRRRVTSRAHPDYHRLERDKPTVISVAALTPVLARAHQMPVEARRQVFVIQPAEALEPEGAARYLKTLEEPPSGTLFLLLSTRPEHLPPTVLSRCQRLRFPPLPADAVGERLVQEGMAPEEARRIAPWSGGSLPRARRMHRAGLPGIAAALLEAARGEEPSAARAAEAALRALDGAAESLAAQSEEGGPDRRREWVRALLVDLLRILSVEARDAAAGRACRLLEDVSPEAALDVLPGLGSLATAVASNVTPAVVLIETVALMRRHRGTRGP